MPTERDRRNFHNAFRELHRSVRAGMLDRYEFPKGQSPDEQQNEADEMWIAAIGVALTEAFIAAYGAIRIVDSKTTLRELVEMAFEEAKQQCEAAEANIAAKGGGP